MLELTITSPYLGFPLQLRTKRVRGRLGKVSPIGWAHVYLSANNGTTIGKRESMRRGREGVGADSIF